MAKEQPKIKAKWCQFVLYPESQDKVIEWVQTNYCCAWALHDKDTWLQADADRWNGKHSDLPFPYSVGSLKKPHVHFLVQFVNPRWFSAVAKEMGVPLPTINRADKPKEAYEYLIHLNHPDKFQYDQKIIGTHNFQIPSSNSDAPSEEEEQVCKLLDMPHFGTTAECARWAFDNGCWAAFRKGYGIWRDIRAERIMNTTITYATSKQNPDMKDFSDPEHSKYKWRNVDGDFPNE